MRCIYVGVFKWLIMVVLVYIMFVALLSSAIVIAGMAMFVIFYVDFIGDKVCNYIRRKNVERVVFGQY